VVKNKEDKEKFYRLVKEMLNKLSGPENNAYISKL
jgi:hypothetical protein